MFQTFDQGRQLSCLQDVEHLGVLCNCSAEISANPGPRPALPYIDSHGMPWGAVYQADTATTHSQVD